jgi:type I restriction enzyme S subunit
VLRIQYGQGLPERKRDLAGDVPVYGSAGRVGKHLRALVNGPTVIIGRKGSVGSTYLEKGPSWPIDTVYFAQVPPHLSAEFVTYQLQHMRLQDLDSSTAVPSLRREDLETQRVAIAPRAEQERIVAAIEEQFSRLDAGMAAIERLRRKLGRMWASVLSRAIRGQLLTEEQADWATTDLVESRLETRVSRACEPTLPVGSYSGSCLPLPEGWRWLRAGDVADFVDPQPSHRTPPEYPSGIPYVGYSEITPYGTLDLAGARKVAPDVLHEHRRRYHLSPGDFILGKIGTLGRPFALPLPFDYALSANVLLVQPRCDAVLPEYLVIFFESPYAEAQLWAERNQSVQAAFGIKKAREFLVALPPLDEQARIVNEVARCKTVVRAAELTLRAVESRAARLRSSILIAAFSGKLVPQDSTDEPASVLLERNTAERRSSGSRRIRPTQLPLVEVPV